MRDQLHIPVTLPRGKSRPPRHLCNRRLDGPRRQSGFFAGTLLYLNTKINFPINYIFHCYPKLLWQKRNTNSDLSVSVSVTLHVSYNHSVIEDTCYRRHTYCALDTGEGQEDLKGTAHRPFGVEIPLFLSIILFTQMQKSKRTWKKNNIATEKRSLQ